MDSSVTSEDIVQVVYALPGRQWIISIPFEKNMTALDAVHLSELMLEHPEIQEQEFSLGLYGKKINLDYLLSVGDRVEICRSLINDPREMRKEQIRVGRVMGQSD
tara:strand:+ start:236 stop:550 length:315 start_codon:yes stop_codon:yes gene_type:complete